VVRLRKIFRKFFVFIIVGLYLVLPKMFAGVAEILGNC
jgi:hypothetical protein